MLVNIHHDNPAEHRRLLVSGVVLLTVVALLIWFSVAIYNKRFEPATMVTFKADRAGLQLAKGGDVRVHGVLVGQVREISQDGEQADIRVAFRPEAAREIPSNISAEILPTTLFGQKFIAIVDPEQPSGRPLRDGDVVPSERVETNVELSRILADLFPLLRSISPADLNKTLYALATGLAGNGDDLGELMTDLEGYVGRLNTRLPTLRQDLRLLADVSRTYELAAPDLLRLMRNATTTARTVSEKEAELASFLGDLTGMAETSGRVLRENEQGLIRLGELSRPLLRLLDTYSPQYPCLLRGLDRYTASLSEIFANARVNQVLELGSVQKEAYDAGDRPEYGEVGHGPWCLGLPSPDGPVDVPLRDGSDQDEVGARRGPALPFATGTGFRNPTSGYAGTASEQRLVNTLLAAQARLPRGTLGSLSALLYGPQLRGTRVDR